MENRACRNRTGESWAPGNEGSVVIAWGDGRLGEDQTPFAASGSASGSPGPAGWREQSSRRPSRFGEKDTPSLSRVNHTCQPRAPQVTRRPGKGLGRHVLWCGGRGEAGNPFLTPATSHCQGGTSGEPACVSAAPQHPPSPLLCAPRKMPCLSARGPPPGRLPQRSRPVGHLPSGATRSPGRPSRAGGEKSPAGYTARLGAGRAEGAGAWSGGRAEPPEAWAPRLLTGK